MVSWAALAGGAVLGGLSVRSWARVARHWGDPAARPSPTPWARVVGPAAARRLTQGSLLHSVCLSGLTLVLLGGAWLPAAGDAGPRSPFAFTVALTGLAAFVCGCLGQLSLVSLGRPRFVLPPHSRGVAGGLPRPQIGPSTGRAPGEVSAAPSPGHQQEGEILVLRDTADSYAQLRRYKVYLDGRRTGTLRRGEHRALAVPAGPHTVQVRISWCTSPAFRVEVAPGDRLRLICRARPGAASDPAAVHRLRHEFLVLHAV